MIPTVISARPLENAILDYIERHDLAGLREFLAAQRAPDIADVLDRLPSSERDLAFAQLPPRSPPLYWRKQTSKQSDRLIKTFRAYRSVSYSMPFRRMTPLGC